MPTPRGWFSTSVVNGKVYAIGGVINFQPLSSVEIYHPTTDRWTKGRDMPTSRGWFSTSAIKGKIYAIGGSPEWPGVPVSRVIEFHTGFAVNVKEKLPTLWGMLKAKN